MVQTAVAENTRRIIKDRGLKQNAVAEKAGFSVQQFSALLNRRKIIKDVDVIAIANALEVTPNDLFFNSAQKRSRKPAHPHSSA